MSSDSDHDQAIEYSDDEDYQGEYNPDRSSVASTGVRASKQYRESRSSHINRNSNSKHEQKAEGFLKSSVNPSNILQVFGQTTPDENNNDGRIITQQPQVTDNVKQQIDNGQPQIEEVEVNKQSIVSQQNIYREQPQSIIQNNRQSVLSHEEEIVKKSVQENVQLLNQQVGDEKNQQSNQVNNQQSKQYVKVEAEIEETAVNQNNQPAHEEKNEQNPIQQTLIENQNQQPLQEKIEQKNQQLSDQKLEIQKINQEEQSAEKIVGGQTEQNKNNEEPKEEIKQNNLNEGENNKQTQEQTKIQSQPQVPSEVQTKVQPVEAQVQVQTQAEISVPTQVQAPAQKQVQGQAEKYPQQQASSPSTTNQHKLNEQITALENEEQIKLEEQESSNERINEVIEHEKKDQQQQQQSPLETVTTQQIHLVEGQIQEQGQQNVGQVQPEPVAQVQNQQVHPVDPVEQVEKVEQVEQVEQVENIKKQDQNINEQENKVQEEQVTQQNVKEQTCLVEVAQTAQIEKVQEKQQQKQEQVIPVKEEQNNNNIIEQPQNIPTQSHNQIQNAVIQQSNAVIQQSNAVQNTQQNHPAQIQPQQIHKQQMKQQINQVVNQQHHNDPINQNNHTVQQSINQIPVQSHMDTQNSQPILSNPQQIQSQVESQSQPIVQIYSEIQPQVHAQTHQQVVDNKQQVGQELPVNVWTKVQSQGLINNMTESENNIVPETTTTYEHQQRSPREIKFQKDNITEQQLEQNPHLLEIKHEEYHIEHQVSQPENNQQVNNQYNEKVEQIVAIQSYAEPTQVNPPSIQNENNSTEVAPVAKTEEPGQIIEEVEHMDESPEQTRDVVNEIQSCKTNNSPTKQQSVYNITSLSSLAIQRVPQTQPNTDFNQEISNQNRQLNEQKSNITDNKLSDEQFIKVQAHLGSHNIPPHVLNQKSQQFTEQQPITKTRGGLDNQTNPQTQKLQKTEEQQDQQVFIPQGSEVKQSEIAREVNDEDYDKSRTISKKIQSNKRKGPQKEQKPDNSKACDCSIM